MRMRIIEALLLVVVLILLVSCASLKAYPNRATDPQAEIKALDTYLQPTVITRYESPEDKDRNGLSKQAWRNEVVNARLRADDLKFNAFQQRLFQEGVGFGVATDWIVLGLNAAGSLAGGAANVLAATSAGVVGAKAAFDRKAFFEKTMPALMATMVAKRKDVLVRIRTGLSKNIDEYPLTLALSDLESYYNAGSIPGAIIEVGEAAGATAKNADAKLEKLTIVTPVPEDLQKRREEAANFVKELNQDQQKALAKSLDLPSSASLPNDILIMITKAQSTEAFDLVAQKIKILFGNEGKEF